MAKGNSRGARWNAAVLKAKEAADALSAAMEELRDIQQEYSDWKDNLPENLQSSALGEKLDAVCDLDLEYEEPQGLEEADGIDLPQGFGRD